MKIRLMPCLFLPFAFCLTLACARGPERPANGPGEGYDCGAPVATVSGQVQGAIDPGGSTCLWKGIPYAAPPVGDSRWKAPQPTVAWEGVRDTTHWGDFCMQLGVYKLLNHTRAKYSEDCLNLNVWRPRKPGTFPVMVFIHGGGYFMGAGASPWYFGDRLSANGDVIVVTINYRLNAFGFFAHEELAKEDPNKSTGNYGTLDQVAALKWVKGNIDNFGGDPGNVTIFGESAGGWSICAMMATPLASGLFQKAILESGGCEAVWPIEKGFESGRWAAGKLGCAANDLSCLRGKSAGEILDKIEINPIGYVTGGGFRYLNHQDGYVFPAGSALAQLKSGNFNNVPLIAGSNRSEVQPLYLIMWDRYFKTPESYAAKVRRDYGPSAETILKLYPAESYGHPGLAYMDILTDRALNCPTYEAVKAVAPQQKATYYYRFDYTGQRMGRALGAMHAMELPFVFEAFDRWPFFFIYDISNQKSALALSKIIQNYWIRFAKTGDPNPEGTATWLPYSPDKPELIVFDKEVKTAVPDNIEKCAFWSEYNKTHDPVWAPGQL